MANKIQERASITLMQRIKGRLRRERRRIMAPPHKPSALGDVQAYTERDALDALMLERKSVDLVRAEDAYLWVYRRDNLYDRILKEDRNLHPGALQSLSPGLPHGPEYTALSHVMAMDSAAPLFDIGCNYGREGIRMARMARAAGHAHPIFMFDPGVAGKLAQLNMPLNGLDNFEYYNIAIGDQDGHLLVHMVDGQSQDNKIINKGEKSVSVPVASMRLDTFMKRRGLGGKACFVKCDTQGAEFEVFKGFRNNSLFRRMAAVIEFFPNGLATRIRPADFLKQLCDEFEVYDLGPHRKFFYKLNANDLGGVLERIQSFDPPFTDLLLLAPDLPQAAELNGRLQAEFGHLDGGSVR